MNRRGVILILVSFFTFAILAAAAQKNQVVPKTVDNAAQQKAKMKEAEVKNNVLKNWTDEVAYIITPEELKAFKKLTRDEEREAFTENFWLVRDNTPDTPENEFRDQFYERIDYANDHFTSGIAGYRTDRGRMYILNGPPDEIQSHPSGGTFYRPTEEGGGVTNTFPFETWRYRHLDNKGENMIYEFVDLTMSGEYSLQYDPGAKDALKHVPGAGLTDREVALGLDKGDRYMKTNSLMDGMSAAVPVNTYGNNEFDMLQKYNEAFKASEVRYKELIVPASTRLSTNVLPYRVQVNYIRVTQDSVRTLITVQFKNSDLAFHDENGGKIALAHITGALYRSDNRRLQPISQDVHVQMTDREFKEKRDQPTLYQETRWLAPGRYKLHLTVEDKHSQSIGIQDIPIVVPRIPDQALQASSMILAYAITDLPSSKVGTEPFAIGDKKVQPNVTGVYRPNQNLNIFQEFYGLQVDPANHKPSAKFELLISQNKQEVRKIVTESSELAGSGLQMKYTSSVPLTGFAPGKYEVQITVTDNLANDTFVTTGNFTVDGAPSK